MATGLRTSRSNNAGEQMNIGRYALPYLRKWATHFPKANIAIKDPKYPFDSLSDDRDATLARLFWYCTFDHFCPKGSPYVDVILPEWIWGIFGDATGAAFRSLVQGLYDEGELYDKEWRKYGSEFGLDLAHTVSDKGLKIGLELARGAWHQSFKTPTPIWRFVDAWGYANTSDSKYILWNYDTREPKDPVLKNVMITWAERHLPD